MAYNYGDPNFFGYPEMADAGSTSGSQLLDWTALMNSPWFRAGMGYNYGQQGLGSMAGALKQMNDQRLAYINALAGTGKQVTTGQNVQPAQVHGWDPSHVMAMLQLLSALGARG